MRCKKGLEIAWGQRKRGEPSATDDIDSDEETQMSLPKEQTVLPKEEAIELRQRQQIKFEGREHRFVIVSEMAREY